MYVESLGFGGLTKKDKKIHRRRKKGNKKTGSTIGKVKVVIDSRTIIFIDDESKIEEVRERYKNLEETTKIISRMKKIVI